MLNRFSLLCISGIIAAVVMTDNGAPVFRPAAATQHTESAVVRAYTPDEEVYYGLNEATEQERDTLIQTEQRAAGDGTNFNLIQYLDKAERLPFDGAFEDWLQERTLILQNIGYEKLLPFLTAAQGETRWQLSNQGRYNSCAAFGFTNAYQASVLYNIALESGQEHQDYNPMFLYRNTSGGSSGRTLGEILNFNFERGQAATAAVGGYPSLSGTDGASKERRCHAVLLRTTEQVTACLKAGIGVYIGNSTAVRGSKQNTDGVRLAVLSGRWAHSTAFIGYCNVNGNDYFLWRNSHGGRYSAADALDTPSDCCWFTPKTLETFLRSAANYGGAFAVLPQSVRRE